MKRLLFLLILAAAIAGGLYYYKTNQASAVTETAIPRIPVEKHTLANGLDVLLVEDHRLPQVSVNVRYSVGPANEKPGRTGFAHLFEHVMFHKTKHTPKDGFARFLETAGASDINGQTRRDQTVYYETVPTNQLELVLWLESDRLGYLLDELTEEDFKTEQDVVRNERRQTVENTPYGIVDEAVAHLLYPKGHPYYASVIGSHADIQAAQLDDVKSFFKQYYVPNNASIAIVGDIHAGDTLKLAEKYFGTLKKGPDVPPANATTPPITEERRVIVKDRIELPRLYMAWIVPKLLTDEDAFADITADILGGDKLSRLYKSLVYEKQIAQDISATNYSLELGSQFQIVATAAPNHSLEEIEKEIDAQLEVLRTKAPEAAELKGSVQSIERSILFAMERSATIASRINFYNQFMKQPDYVQQDVARFRKATPETIRDFAAKFLTKNARVVVYGEPGEQDLGTPVPTPDQVAKKAGGESVNPDEAWRASPPKPGPEPTITLPSPESFQLSNGLTVLLNSRKGPTVAAILSLRGGAAASPAAKPGLAAFAVDLIDEGTTTLSSLAFSEKLKQSGAQIFEAPTLDSSALVLTMTRANAGSAFDLLADAVLHPAFNKDEVERIRKQRLGQLIQLKDDPYEVAQLVTTISLKGKDNPYAYKAMGTTASVKSITVDDLHNYWKSQASPDNAALVVSGDFTKDELQRFLETSFGKWPKSETSAFTIPEAPVTKRLVLVDTPGTPQTQLRLAIPGPKRATPDYETLQVMNQILGGTFNSRINMNLRVRNGFSYGAGSQFETLAQDGWFAAGSGVRTEVTDKALKEIVKEVSRMGSDPATDDEMMLAKSSLIRSLPASFETSMDTVSMYYDIFVYRLPLDYYSQFTRKVDAVTKEDVLNVARKYLLPDKMLVVAVGDRKTIESGLRKLNYGPIEARDTDGNLTH